MDRNTEVFLFCFLIFEFVSVCRSTHGCLDLNCNQAHLTVRMWNSLSPPVVLYNLKWTAGRAIKRPVSGTLWSWTAPETRYTVALSGCGEGSSEVFYQITRRNCACWTFQGFSDVFERAAWKVALLRSRLGCDCFLSEILILCPLQYLSHSTQMPLLNDSGGYVIVQAKDNRR